MERLTALKLKIALPLVIIFLIGINIVVSISVISFRNILVASSSVQGTSLAINSFKLLEGKKEKTEAVPQPLKQFVVTLLTASVVIMVAGVALIFMMASMVAGPVQDAVRALAKSVDALAVSEKDKQAIRSAAEALCLLVAGRKGQ